MRTPGDNAQFEADPGISPPGTSQKALEDTTQDPGGHRESRPGHRESPPMNDAKAPRGHDARPGGTSRKSPGDLANPGGGGDASPPGSTRKSPPVRLVFYDKVGCSLCEEAFSVVEEVRERLGASSPTTLERVDIRDNPFTWDRYRYDVPVLEVDGRPQFRLRIDAGRLVELLTGGVSGPME